MSGYGYYYRIIVYLLKCEHADVVKWERIPIFMKHMAKYFVGEGSNITLTTYCLMVQQKRRDFPGGAVVKNLPANAGDTGSSPGPGRSHMLWSN